MLLSALLPSSERRPPLDSTQIHCDLEDFAATDNWHSRFFIYIYVFNVDIQQIISEIGQINLRYYLMAGIARAVLDILFLALGWHSLLSFLKVKFSRLRSFALVWVGIFARATLWLRFFIGFGAQQWLGLKDIIIRGDKAQIRID